jgi:hypothetical protein
MINAANEARVKHVVFSSVAACMCSSTSSVPDHLQHLLDFSTRIVHITLVGMTMTRAEGGTRRQGACAGAPPVEEGHRGAPPGLRPQLDDSPPRLLLRDLGQVRRFGCTFVLSALSAAALRRRVRREASRLNPPCKGIVSGLVKGDVKQNWVSLEDVGAVGATALADCSKYSAQTIVSYPALPACPAPGCCAFARGTAARACRARRQGRGSASHARSTTEQSLRSLQGGQDLQGRGRDILNQLCTLPE